MKDKQGRPYATPPLSVGTKIQVDGDFTCTPPWSIHTVKGDGDGQFFMCSGHKDNKHYLSGQLDDEEKYYVGIYLAP